MVNLPKNKAKLKKDLSTIKEEDPSISQSGFDRKLSLPTNNEIKEEIKEETKEEIKEEVKEETKEENKENELDVPIQEKIPEKTFSKDIENNENLKKNEPLIQSVGPDYIDNLQKLPTFQEILKGESELLPIIKRKKY